MLAQLLSASPQQSAAFGEGYTITYGYAYLRTGDARLSRGQNPPLTNIFVALPLLLRDDVAFPIEHATWAKADIYGFSDEFLWKANIDRAAQLVLLARWPEMALALLLACVVNAFTRSLFGETAALIAGKVPEITLFFVFIYLQEKWIVTGVALGFFGNRLTVF